jgi:hypothetical protein
MLGAPRHNGCVAVPAEEILCGGTIMPEGKHLRGVSEKEQKMYEHIKDEAKEDHRYGKRAEEVAARTVMKHHREEHHKKGE